MAGAAFHDIVAAITKVEPPHTMTTKIVGIDGSGGSGQPAKLVATTDGPGAGPADRKDALAQRHGWMASEDAYLAQHKPREFADPAVNRADSDLYKIRVSGFGNLCKLYCFRTNQPNLTLREATLAAMVRVAY